MEAQTYLDFEGRCQEALDYYQRTLGAQVVMTMRHGEAPQQAPPGALPPGAESKIMHAAFRLGDTLVLATDGACSGKAQFGGFRLVLSVDSAAEVDRVFAALADGGTISQPLSATFFSPRFGMLVDRFGVGWAIMVPQSGTSSSSVRS